MLCSLKLSSRNADCSLERRSFLRALEVPSSSSLARDDERSPQARAAAASAWAAARRPRSSGKEPALSLGDDDDRAPATGSSSSSSSSGAANALAPAAPDGARFTSNPRVDASRCPAEREPLAISATSPNARKNKTTKIQKPNTTKTVHAPSTHW